MTSDLVFTRCDLDALIRQAVRKYAPLFIRRKIILSYEPVHCEVLTDENGSSLCWSRFCQMR